MRPARTMSGPDMWPETEQSMSAIGGKSATKVEGINDSEKKMKRMHRRNIAKIAKKQINGIEKQGNREQAKYTTKFDK